MGSSKINTSRFTVPNPLKDFYDRSASAVDNYDPLQDPTSDEWYLNHIKQYENDPMYNELLNNPHLRSNNLPYSPTFWDNIASSLGDYSARDTYYQDLLSKRNDLLNDWLSRRAQREYDTPAAQASRMAAAGQNADLLGTSGVASAPENDQPAQPSVMHSPDESRDNFSSIAQVGFSLISSIFGMAKGLQSLKLGNYELIAQDIANSSSEIGLSSSAMDLASKALVNTVSLSDDDMSKLESDPSFIDSVLLDSAKKFDLSGYSSRTRRALSKWFSSLQRDPNNNSETLFYKTAKAELLNKYTKLNTENALLRSHSYYDDDLDKMVEKYSKDFQWYQDEILKLHNKYRNKALENALKVENKEGIADARASAEIYNSEYAKHSASQAEYVAKSTKAQYESNVPQWEIDRLNNEFRARLYRGSHSLGTVGSFGALFVPKALELAEDLGTAYLLGRSPMGIGVGAANMYQGYNPSFTY